MITLSTLKKLIEGLDDSCIVSVMEYGRDEIDPHILIHLPDKSGTYLDIPVGWEDTLYPNPPVWMDKHDRPTNNPL